MKSLSPDVSIDKRADFRYTLAHHASEHIDLTEMRLPFTGCIFDVTCRSASPERPSETRISAVQTKTIRSAAWSPLVRPMTVCVVALVRTAVPAFQSVRITRPFA